MIAYHVVTDHPMSVGQQIVFDENHHSGVYQRVQDKMEIVRQIYADPAAYQSKELEHHTAVALRELAMEEVRQKMFPHYPSRMACLYVSKTLASGKPQSDRPVGAVSALHKTGARRGDRGRNACHPKRDRRLEREKEQSAGQRPDQ